MCQILAHTPGTHALWHAQITFKAHGFLSRVIQHEVDHLDGVSFVERMDARTLVHDRTLERTAAAAAAPPPPLPGSGIAPE